MVGQFGNSVLITRQLQMTYDNGGITMAKNKNDAKKPSNYITTIRDGAVAANIFRGMTPDGHAYLYFSLSRSWKSATGNRQGYTDRFYDRNGAAIQNVVAKACAWMRDNPEAADGVKAEEPARSVPAAA
jgi:hypothetical protein